jgi:hypothetical protein
MTALTVVLLVFLCGPVATIGFGIIKDDKSIRDWHIIGLIVAYVAIAAFAWIKYL